MASAEPESTGCSVESATRWCLEHLDSLAAALIGVEAGAATADFHIVPLRVEDLVADVATLSIPPSWHTLVVVADGALLESEASARIGVGVDRSGATHVERRTEPAAAAQPRRGWPVA